MGEKTILNVPVAENSTDLEGRVSELEDEMSEVKDDLTALTENLDQLQDVVNAQTQNILFLVQEVGAFHYLRNMGEATYYVENLHP